MPHHATLAIEAMRSYRADRKAEAALLYRRAASAALDVGDQNAWFQHLTWAAITTHEEGNSAAALALLLKAREGETNDAEDTSWRVRILVLEITAATHPDVGQLRKLLADLHDFAREHQVPPGDLPWLEGNFRVQRGEFVEALHCYEAAWRDHEGLGFIRCHSAEDAAQCCLRLGRIAAAQSWIRALKLGGETDFAAHDYWQGELSLRVALIRSAPNFKRLQLLRSYLDRTLLVRRDDVTNEARELAVRIHLLNSSEGDPAVSGHPAHNELRRRRAGKYDVHARYSGRLLFLDYRLACVRYSAGVLAVDDFYYARPQKIPILSKLDTSKKFRQRLSKARAAVKWAMAYALRLDGLLDCDWRQREVKSRVHRIEAIANAVQRTFRKHKVT